MATSLNFISTVSVAGGARDRIHVPKCVDDLHPGGQQQVDATVCCGPNLGRMPSEYVAMEMNKDYYCTVAGHGCCPDGYMIECNTRVEDGEESLKCLGNEPRVLTQIWFATNDRRQDTCR